jgi:hypothetical protein
LYRLPEIIIAGTKCIVVTTLSLGSLYSSSTGRNRCFASSKRGFGTTTNPQMAECLSNGASSKRIRNYFPLENTFVWIVTPCICVEVHRRLGGKESPPSSGWKSKPSKKAQAVRRRLPTTAARVRLQVMSYRICGGDDDTGAGLFRVFRFPLPILIPPTAPHSSSSNHPGLVMKNRGSSVGIETGYGLNGRGSIPGSIKIFLYSTASSSALGPTRPPFQRAPEALSPRIMQPEHESGHSSQALS